MNSPRPLLSFKEKVSYGFGDLASVLYWQTFMLYFTYFYTDVFLLPASVAATMFLISRLFDGINDPLMGIIADRTNTRWGKFRPYLLWMSVPFAIAGVLAFSVPDFSMTGKIIYAYCTFLLIMILYTAINIPYTALMGVMSPNSMDRTKLSSYKFVFAFTAGIIVSATLLPMTRALSDTDDETKMPTEIAAEMGTQMTAEIDSIMATEKGTIIAAEESVEMATKMASVMAKEMAADMASEMDIQLDTLLIAEETAEKATKRAIEKASEIAAVKSLEMPTKMTADMTAGMAQEIATEMTKEIAIIMATAMVMEMDTEKSPEEITKIATERAIEMIKEKPATEGWTYTFIIYGIIAVIFYLIAFKGTRERVKASKKQQTSVKKDLLALISNKPWVILFVATITFILFVSIRLSITAHYFKYLVDTRELTLPFLGTRYYTFETLVSAYNTIGQICSLLGVFIITFTAKVLGKKKTFLLFLTIAAFSSGIVYIISPENLGWIYFFQITGSLSGGPLSVLLWAMYADTADFGEWKFHRRSTGLVFSASTMSQKFGWAIGAYVALTLLATVGYSPNVPQTADSAIGILRLFSIIPASFGVLAMVFIIIYPLNEKKVNEMSTELQERRSNEEKDEEDSDT